MATPQSDSLDTRRRNRDSIITSRNRDSTGVLLFDLDLDLGSSYMQYMKQINVDYQ